MNTSMPLPLPFFQVEKSGDESVQLKALQTALTLLQSPLHPTSQDDICAVLGTCFRMLSAKGHKDTVVTTATATVRQAVALVFSYVDVQQELARIDRAAHGRQEQAQQAQQAQLAPVPAESEQSEAAEGAAVAAEHSVQLSTEEVGSAQEEAGSVSPAAGTPVAAAAGDGPAGEDGAQVQPQEEAPAPTVQAAHKLLEDLCAIAAGEGEEEGSVGVRGVGGDA